MTYNVDKYQQKVFIYHYICFSISGSFFKKSKNYRILVFFCKKKYIYILLQRIQIESDQ